MFSTFHMFRRMPRDAERPLGLLMTLIFVDFYGSALSSSMRAHDGSSWRTLDDIAPWRMPGHTCPTIAHALPLPDVRPTWQNGDAVSLVQKKHPGTPIRRPSTKKSDITKSRVAPKEPAKAQARRHDVPTAVAASTSCSPPSLMGQVWLDKAAKLGSRLATLLHTTPPGLRLQLEAELTGEVVRLFRRDLRRALLLGTLLLPSGTMTPSSSSSSATSMANSDFVGSLARTNVAMISDLLNQAGRVIRRPQPWPTRESQLLQLAPELRQLTTWAMTLGENEEMEDTPSSILPTETETSPLQAAVQQTAPHGATTRPQSNALSHTIGSGPPPPGIAPNTAMTDDLNVPEFDVDDQALLQTIPEKQDGRNAGQEYDDDALALVQSTLTTGSGSEEEELVLRHVGSNIEDMLSFDSIAHDVENTLATLWERGEEYTVQGLVYHLQQLTGQVDADADDTEGYVRVALVIQPYLNMRTTVLEVPAVLWQNWLANTVRSLRTTYVRARARRWRDTNLNCGGPNARHPNANVNAEQMDDVSLMDRGRPVLKAATKKHAKASRQSTTAKRRSGKPQHPEHGPHASLSHSWARAERDAPRSRLPHSRWLRNPPPWRHAAPHLRRRSQGPRMRKSPAARCAPEPAAGDRGSAPSTLGIAAPSATVNLTEPHQDGTGENHQVDDLNEGDQDFEPEFAENATATWRQLLGMARAVRDAEAHGDGLDGGLTSSQQSDLVAVVQGLTAAERNQLLASLGFFLSSILMDVANVMHLTPLARPPRGTPAMASASRHPGDDRDGRLPEEDPEEEVPLEHDDHALMQQHGSPLLRQPPRIAYSCFTLLLEALGAALDELCPRAQQQVACHMLQEVRAWGPSADARTLVQLFAAMCPGEEQRPSLLPVLGDGETRWFHRWLDIIRRNLSASAGTFPPEGADLADGDARSAADDPYLTPGPLDTNAPTSTSHDAGTQTAPELCGPDLTCHHAEILVTMSTSEEQLSHRLPALRVRPGECVAVSLIASLRPSNATVPDLDQCSHEYQYCRYVPPRLPGLAVATTTNATSSQSPPKKPKTEAVDTPTDEVIKHEGCDGFGTDEAPELAPAVTAATLSQDKTYTQCVVVD